MVGVFDANGHLIWEFRMYRADMMLNLGGHDGSLAGFSGPVLILNQKGDKRSSSVFTKMKKCRCDVSQIGSYLEWNR
jgi:hypothetical protein